MVDFRNWLSFAYCVRYLHLDSFLFIFYCISTQHIFVLILILCKCILFIKLSFRWNSNYFQFKLLDFSQEILIDFFIWDSSESEETCTNGTGEKQFEELIWCSFDTHMLKYCDNQTDIFRVFFFFNLKAGN
jgi:hypothetical protein